MAIDPLTTEAKANFSDIYIQDDPRTFFHTLGALDYQVPRQAAPIIEGVLSAIPNSGSPQTVLDLCCSYGVNSAVLKHDLDVADLRDHYAAPGMSALSSHEVTDADREMFARRDQRQDLSILGLDLSEPAINYGIDTGLLSDGWAENLEAHDPSQQFADGIADCDLVISTGGVGYIGHSTFERIMNASPRPEDLWFAIFALRVFDYKEIEDVLAPHGLVTEKVAHNGFPQRRFESGDEQNSAINDVRNRGLDPAGMETEGWFYADCFISRPAKHADVPLSQILTAA